MKKVKWCIVCGRIINPLSQRWRTCGEYCRGRYKCGDTPFLRAPKRNSVAEVAILASTEGLSYGMYVAQKERPVKIRCNDCEEETTPKEKNNHED